MPSQKKQKQKSTKKVSLKPKQTTKKATNKPKQTPAKSLKPKQTPTKSLNKKKGNAAQSSANKASLNSAKQTQGGGKSQKQKKGPNLKPQKSITKTKGKNKKAQFNKKQLIPAIQSGGGYSPVIACSSPTQTLKGGKIIKTSVWARIGGKKVKLRKYNFAYRRDDHSAIAGMFRFIKETLKQDQYSPEVEKFILETQGHVVRVDPVRRTKDFVVLPKSEDEGDGTIAKPFRFTNVGLAYVSENTTIEIFSTIFERGRSNLAGVLRTIAPNRQGSLFAPQGGVENMRAVENADENTDSAAVRTARGQIEQFANNHNVGDMEELKEALEDARPTPPRTPSLSPPSSPSLTSFSPLPPPALNSPHNSPSLNPKKSKKKK